VPDDFSGAPASSATLKVGEVGVALLVQQDVGGLHVPVDHALSVGRRQRGRHLIQDLAGAFRIERSLREEQLQAPAPEEPHHQVGGVGLAPVVVERNDVRVFQASHDLGLPLEPAYEVRVVGELGRHGLDRDLTPDLGLRGPVDHAERTLADLLEQAVPA